MKEFSVLQGLCGAVERFCEGGCDPAFTTTREGLDRHTSVATIATVDNPHGLNVQWRHICSILIVLLSI
jgi:hypothetical protein